MFKYEVEYCYYKINKNYISVLLAVDINYHLMKKQNGKQKIYVISVKKIKNV
jgi:hypothetical protein